MFFVVNKDKLYSYIVTLSMVGVLFTISAVFPKDSVETSTRNTYNQVDSVEVKNEILST